jgi:hypothetical protein
MIKLIFPVSGKRLLHVFVCLSSLLPILVTSPAARAQTQQQPFLFAYTTVNGQETVVTFLRDETTGVLTLLPAAPIPFKDLCLPEAIDQQSPPNFLFGVCANGLAMYSFDSTSGAVAEISSSPYTAPNTTGNGAYAVAEATGQYVYLVKFTLPDAVGNYQFILDQFQIDRTTPSLVPLTSVTLPFLGQLGGIYPDPNHHGIAIYTTVTDNAVPPGTQVPTLFLITFDPVTGAANVPAVGTAFPGTNAVSFAGSPSGNSVVIGSSNGTVPGPGTSGTVTVLSLTATAFQITGSAALQAPDGTWANTLISGPAGTLFYAQYVAGPGMPVPAPFHIYTTSPPAELSTSPLPFADWPTVIDSVSDPNGSFLYSANSTSPNTGIQVYFVEPSTGYPSQTGALTSPFGQAYVLAPIFATLAGNGGGQPSSGPMLSLNTVSLNFGQVIQGQTSASQTVTLSSVGSEAVSLTSIAITGTSAADFAESDTCSPVLASAQSCTISLTFHPVGMGTSLAALSITDNSPGSPQMIPLSGTSVAPPTPTPVAAFTPAGTFNLAGTTTVGTVASAQNLILTNTGNAPMHVASIVLGGANANDFSLGTSSCIGTLAVNSNCSIPIIFAPVATGIRSSTVTVTDDAAGSPQVIAVNGTAAQVASISPAANGGSTSASITAGQTAQFLLQALPGPGFAGTVTFTCSGQPFGAACSVPGSVAISNGTPAPFTISVSTLAAGAATPEAHPPAMPFSRPAPWRPLAVVSLLAILLASRVRHTRHYRIVVPALNAIGVLLLAVLLAFSGIGCGGGASQATPPPPAQAQQQQLQTATPALLPAGGTFTGAQSASISDTTAGATIYYTTDGTTPTASSAIYSGPISLDSATTVQAIATASGYTTSSVASANYKFQTPSGTYTITVIPTVTLAGSSKSWQLNAVLLTLSVK